MNKFDIEQIINRVACRYQSTPAEVRMGIAEAIQYGWNDPDPDTHGLWALMSPTGECPTVEEVIVFLSVMLVVDDDFRQRWDEKTGKLFR